MMEKITFCETCRKDEPYYLKTITMKSTLKDEEYKYTGKQAFCSECNAEVYVTEIEDGNLKALYDAFRQKNGIISLENILKIPQKYNIGKRPLSLLLNWGEMTFSRYYEGDMPTKQYSETLQRIYDDPEFYMSILEENKGNLRSLTAYEKSKRTTLELLGQAQLVKSKVDEVISYLLFQCEDITPLALQKALYYVQGLYYAFMDTFLFEDDCEAWVHGPVYRNIYNRYSSYRFDPIEVERDFDISIFTDGEKAIMDSVIQYFCCYSGKILEYFTHSEIPWLKARGNLPAEAHSNRIISKETIGEYFTAVKQKYNMLVPDDIENYAKVMFERTMKR